MEVLKIENQENVTQIIIDTINTLFSNLFSSIDNSLFSILDNLTFIDSSILNNSYMEKLLGNNAVSTSIIVIANSLLLAFVIYYCCRLLFSNLIYVQLERPHQFIFRLLIFALLMNFSYFICEQFLNINNLISSSIQSVGKNLFNCELNFNTLISKLNSIISIEQNSFNIFSLDGIIKGFISFGLLNLIFSYALRYILVKVFILISPFAFLSLITSSTSWFFKTWFRSFFSLLILQIFITFILLVLFSVDYSSNDLFCKFIYIGGIYSLTKANSYIREIIGGISTDVSTYFSNFKNFTS